MSYLSFSSWNCWLSFAQPRSPRRRSAASSPVPRCRVTIDGKTWRMRKTSAAKKTSVDGEDRDHPGQRAARRSGSAASSPTAGSSASARKIAVDHPCRVVRVWRMAIASSSARRGAEERDQHDLRDGPGLDLVRAHRRQASGEPGPTNRVVRAPTARLGSLRSHAPDSQSSCSVGWRSHSPSAWRPRARPRILSAGRQSTSMTSGRLRAGTRASSPASA